MLRNIDGPSIMKVEAERAINKIKGGKTAGPESINLEMKKVRKEFGVVKIAEICSDIYELGYIPQEMKHK